MGVRRASGEASQAVGANARAVSSAPIRGEPVLWVPQTEAGLGAQKCF